MNIKWDPGKFASFGQYRRVAKLLDKMPKECADRIIGKYKLEVVK